MDRSAPGWHPVRDEAVSRLFLFMRNAGRSYAKSRNIDAGWEPSGPHGPVLRPNVSGLSPWLQRRLVSEEEVLATVTGFHGVDASRKFISEVMWRTYMKGYMATYPGIWAAYLKERNRQHARLEHDGHLRRSYKDACDGVTGIECFDHWVRELRHTGYLHNHARMWFASIWIFTLRLPWALGADLFEQHLLDFDVASNTLNWRWVAGLHTNKRAYAAKASNIAVCTSERFRPSQPLAKDPSPIVEKATFERLALPRYVEPLDFDDTGVLLTLEDLYIEESPMTELRGVRAVAGGIPREVYARGASELRRRFDAGALMDGLQRAGHHFGCDGHRLPDGEGWLGSTLQWAEDHGLRRVLIMAPQVGDWESPLARLMATLQGRGIATDLVQRDWDTELFPHASGGFSRFRDRAFNLLPRLLSTDNALARHGTPLRLVT